MHIIPTPDEAASYDEFVKNHPGIEEVLAKIIRCIQRSKGNYTWFDADLVPSRLYQPVRYLLNKKGWNLKSGYNEEEWYSYLSVERCQCQCCKAASKS